jgi:dihydroneopterin aldolase
MILVQTGFRQLEISCVIGVYPEERVKPQQILLDIEVVYDGSLAIQTDTEVDGVDYTRVASVAQETCVNGQFGLLETLVYQCAIKILGAFPMVWEVMVKVTKPQGLPGAQGSFAKITQQRQV